MANRIKTTKKEIAEYWKDHLDSTNVSEKNAATCCWRCGIKKRLDRCHIVPSSQGGEDVPSNFILLCKHCHIDNPNIDNVDIMWDWIKAYQLEDGESLWLNQGIREYQYIYKESLSDRLKDEDISWEIFEPYLKKQLDMASYHFGQPGFNRATVAGAIRLALNEIGDEPHECHKE